MLLVPRLMFLSAVAPVLAGTVAAAADPLRDDGVGVRVVGNVLVGTAGFEPGVAAELTCHSEPGWDLRPELFISRDGRPGAAVSLGWDVRPLSLPAGQNLMIGPRVVYHNSDDYGWGADLMGIYSINIVPSMPGRHYLEVIGTLGAIEDKRDDDDHKTRLGASIGLGYGYQF